MGSTDLQFIPKAPICRLPKYFMDCGTAGSITLMAQIALPLIATYSAPGAGSGASTELELWGGTNVSHCPPVDHLQHVLLPLLRDHFGLESSLAVQSRGYYPRGGGKVTLTATAPSALRPINLTEQGSLIGMGAVVWGCADLALRRRTGAALTALLAREPIVARDGSSLSVAAVEVPDYPADRGTRVEKVLTLGVQLFATTSTGCVLSANQDIQAPRNAKVLPEADAEAMVQKVARELRELCASGACVDELTADQLVIYMALAAGESRVLVSGVTTSLHLETALKIAGDVAKVRFSVEPAEGGNLLVTRHA